MRPKKKLARLDQPVDENKKKAIEKTGVPIKIHLLKWSSKISIRIT